MKNFSQSILILLVLTSITFIGCKTNSAFSCPDDKPIACSENICVSDIADCPLSETNTTNPRDQINQALKDIDKAKQSLSRSSKPGRSIARKVLITLKKIKFALKNEDCEEKVTDVINTLIDISDQVEEKTCNNSARKAITLNLVSSNCISEEDANAFLDIVNDSIDTIFSTLEIDSNEDSIPDVCGKNKSNNKSCPEGKIKCSDGSCRADGECKSSSDCPQETPIRCPNGSCTTDIHQCTTDNLCPNNCSFSGKCDFGTCICDPGFFGKDCSQADSTSSQTCPNNCTNSTHGICKSSGECACNAGFFGKDCSQTDSTSSQTCPNNCTNSTHGTCKSSGECVCNAGFFGKDCSQTDSTASQTCPNNCSFSGDCKSGVCSCHTGFTGKDCSTKL